jgi:hypothetical protein
MGDSRKIPLSARLVISFAVLPRALDDRASRAACVRHAVDLAGRLGKKSTFALRHMKENKVIDVARSVF